MTRIRLTSPYDLDLFPAPTPTDPDPESTYWDDRRAQLEELAQALPLHLQIVLHQMMEGATPTDIARYRGTALPPAQRLVLRVRVLVTHLASIGWLEVPKAHPNRYIAAYLQCLTATRAARSLGVDRGVIVRAVNRRIFLGSLSNDPKQRQLARLLVDMAGLRVLDR